MSKINLIQVIGSLSLQIEELREELKELKESKNAPIKMPSLNIDELKRMAYEEAAKQYSHRDDIARVLGVSLRTVERMSKESKNDQGTN